MQVFDNFFYCLIFIKDCQKLELKFGSERLKYYEKWLNNKVIEVVIFIENF